MRDVARFTRAWIETPVQLPIQPSRTVARFTRAWIETGWIGTPNVLLPSPASRGRGLKLDPAKLIAFCEKVARFTRAWIETMFAGRVRKAVKVARFTRAWIETRKLIT